METSQGGKIERQVREALQGDRSGRHDRETGQGVMTVR